MDFDTDFDKHDEEQDVLASRQAADVDEAREPEPTEFEFVHDDEEAVLSLAVRDGDEIVLHAGERYSTGNRHAIRALDAHSHVDRVDA